MPETQDIFTQDILRRVKRAHFYRAHVAPIALECSALAALVGMSAFFVSLKHVYLNAEAEHSLRERLYFFVSAFMHTELSEKVLSIAMFVVIVLVLKDVSFGITHVAKRFRAAF